jgi:hypothetical protein
MEPVFETIANKNLVLTLTLREKDKWYSIVLRVCDKSMK